MIASSMAAPEANRRVIKLAASIEPGPRAMRVSNELAAKAIRVQPVRSAVFWTGVARVVVGWSSASIVPPYFIGPWDIGSSQMHAIANRTHGLYDKTLATALGGVINVGVNGAAVWTTVPMAS